MAQPEYILKLLRINITNKMFFDATDITHIIYQEYILAPLKSPQKDTCI